MPGDLLPKGCSSGDQERCQGSFILSSVCGGILQWGSSGLYQLGQPPEQRV